MMDEYEQGDATAGGRSAPTGNTGDAGGAGRAGDRSRHAEPDPGDYATGRDSGVRKGRRGKSRSGVDNMIPSTEMAHPEESGE